MLVSNNFSIKFHNADTAYVYQINHGASMAKGFQKRAAFKNGLQAIQSIFGRVVRMRDQMLAFKELTEPQSVDSFDNENVQTVLTFTLKA